jgi:Flp pilus assembly protein TadG
MRPPSFQYRPAGKERLPRRDAASPETRQMLRKLRNRKKLGTDGSIAIEFAFIAPAFLMLLFGILEVSLSWFGGLVLENGMQEVARMIRTGQVAAASMTQAQFRQQLCNRISGLLSCASDRLYIDVRATTTFGATTFPNPLNPNGTFNTAMTNYNVGVSSKVSGVNSIVLVRAFYVWHISTPFIGQLIANMPNNDRLLSASATFRNEPF